MRNTDGASQRYTVGESPTDPTKTNAFLKVELKNIESAMGNIADGFMEMIEVAPDKPRKGMIRLSSAGVLGVNEGVYCYYNATWNYLG